MSEELDNICEECKKENETVSQNLIKHGYKICDSCFTSKTIFPIQLVPKILINPGALEKPIVLSNSP